jgi:hypothetical protein
VIYRTVPDGPGHSWKELPASPGEGGVALLSIFPSIALFYVRSGDDGAFV